jgi:hypothetical protein
MQPHYPFITESPDARTPQNPENQENPENSIFPYFHNIPDMSSPGYPDSAAASLQHSLNSLSNIHNDSGDGYVGTYGAQLSRVLRSELIPINIVAIAGTSENHDTCDFCDPMSVLRCDRGRNAHPAGVDDDASDLDVKMNK